MSILIIEKFVRNSCIDKNEIIKKKNDQRQQIVHQYCVNEYLRKIKMQIKVHVYKVETDQCIYIIDPANLK